MKKVFYLLCLLLFCVMVSMGCADKSELSKGEENISGGPGSSQFTTLGTILRIDLDTGIVTVRVHGEDEDRNYEYKSVVHYLDEEQVDLKFSRPGKCVNFKTGEVISFHYFQSAEGRNPLPVYEAEIIEVGTPM